MVRFLYPYNNALSAVCINYTYCFRYTVCIISVICWILPISYLMHGTYMLCIADNVLRQVMARCLLLHHCSYMIFGIVVTFQYIARSKCCINILILIIWSSVYIPIFLPYMKGEHSSCNSERSNNKSLNCYLKHTVCSVPRYLASFLWYSYTTPNKLFETNISDKDVRCTSEELPIEQPMHHRNLWLLW